MFSRRFAACVCLLILAAQACPGEDSGRIAARYKQLLGANPAPGTALDRLWMFYRDQGATDALLAEYKQKAAAGDLAAALTYGYLLEKAGSLESAREAFEGASALAPKDARPQLALGDLAMKQTKPREAAEAFSRAVERLPAADKSRTEVLINLGNAWAAAREPAKAADAWEQTIAGRPDDPALRRRLAQAYESNGLLKQSAAHYKVIAAHGDAYDRVTALRSLARISQILGDPDAAIAAIEKGMSIAAAGNWLREELQGELIRLHQKFGRVGELEKRWLENVDRNPRDLGAYLQLVDLYGHTNEIEKERQWLAHLVELAPQNADYKVRLARVLIRLNEPAEAGHLYDQLLEAQPDNPDFVFARAEIDVQQGVVARATSRVEAMLAKSGDASIKSRGIEFYRGHRLWNLVEKHLAAAACARDAPPEAALALADFYFAQERPDEARRALQGLAKTDDNPAARAAAWARAGSSLREHGRHADAEDALRHAVELAPRQASYYADLGEVLAAQDKPVEAQQALQKAVELTSDPAARQAADYKLFQLVQERPQAAGTPVPEPKTVIGMLTVPSHDASGSTNNAALDSLLEQISAEATAHPSTETRLRAARWNLWARAYTTAQQFAVDAIASDPAAVEPRDLAVQIFEAAGRTREAVEQLEQLARIDSANASNRLREAARIEAEGGDTASAITTLAKLAEEHPGDVKVLSDYALALQQADRWKDALQVWQQAYEIAGASDRRSIVQPMLGALDHLGRHDRAVTLLLESLDAERDPASKTNLLRDLLQYAQSYDRADWLRTEFERRHRAHPTDYFTLAALARILKSQARDDEAFELLREATYSAPEPIAALEDLVSEGDALGRYEEAIDAQRRLIWMRPRIAADGFEKLAALQETWLDIAAARETWDEIVSRFPRDPAALKHAAAFYMRWQYPDAARDVLRRVRVLDPRDFDSLLNLASLASDDGEAREALSAYEQILESSGAASGDAALRFPARRAVEAGPLQQSYFQAARMRHGMPNPKTMQAVRSFWSETPHEPRSNEDYRLEAIRGISELRRGGGDLTVEDWLREWDRRRDTSPVEALWAYYYSDDAGRALAQMKALVSANPDDATVKQAFVWLALQLKSYGVLREWLASPARQPADRDLFMVALGQELAGSHRRAASALMELLFPPDFRSRQVLWQAAALFAGQGYPEEAGRLGERVFNNAVVNRAEYGNEVGGWYLMAGDIEAARRVLGSAARSLGASFDNAVYESIRRYYLSLPEKERKPFSEGFIEETDRREAPVHAAIVRVLLSGLNGDTDEAETAIDDLIALRPVCWTGDFDEPATQRYWRFILTAGIQLQAWKLNWLAACFWHRALDDEAFIQLQGPSVADLVRELKLRLVAAQLLDDSPAEAPVRIAEFAQASTPEMVVVLASMLENSGSFIQSVQALSYLVQRDPANPQYLRSLFNACRGADDAETAVRAMQAALNHGLAQGSAHAEIIAQCIEFLIGRNELNAAMDLMRSYKGPDAANPQFLEREARIQLARGRLEDAEKAYRSLIATDQNNLSFRFSLAAILEKRGKIDQAIEVIEPAISRTPGIAAEMRLAKLYLKKGEISKVRSLARRLLRAHSGSEVTSLASQLAATGEKRLALVLLQGGVSQLSDPRLLVEWQLQSLPLIDRQREPVLFAKSMARLKEFAGDQPDLASRYYDFRASVADDKDNVFLDELRADWAGGAGSAAAGAKLAETFASGGETRELDQVLDKLLDRGDADVAVLERLADRLTDAKLFGQAIRISDYLIGVQPIQDRLWINYARILAAAGRRTEAVKQLDRLSCRLVLNDSLMGPLAEAYLETGQTAHAEGLFAEAVNNDGAARNFSVFNNYARLLLRKGDTAGAARLLSQAFRNRNNRDTKVLLDYVDAAGPPDAPESAIAALKLPPDITQQGYVALFQRETSSARDVRAIHLVARHPEILDSDPSVVRQLEALADSSGRFGEVAEILEARVAQSDPGDGSASDALARIYAKKGAQELTRDEPDAARASFRRAHALLPGDFGIADQLTEVLLQRGEVAEAAEVWMKVIDATGDDDTKARAKAKLALLPRRS